MLREKQEYISLKEAAKMSGYSPDYVGQLIRGGKLRGKQVFSNVSWVTTEDAIMEYLQKEKRNQVTHSTKLSGIQEWIASPEGLAVVYAIVVWFSICLLAMFILLLAYAFAASVEHRIDQKYLEKVQHAN